MRLVETLECKTEESSLTGESEPTLKQADAVCTPQAPLAERHTSLASTSVVAGHGAGIAVATGMDTAVGQVAAMLAEEETPKTPRSCAWRVPADCLLLACLLSVR